MPKQTDRKRPYPSPVSHRYSHHPTSAGVSGAGGGGLHRAASAGGPGHAGVVPRALMHAPLSGALRRALLRGHGVRCGGQRFRRHRCSAWRSRSTVRSARGLLGGGGGCTTASRRLQVVAALLAACGAPPPPATSVGVRAQLA